MGITPILNTLRLRGSLTPMSNSQEIMNLQESLWGSQAAAVPLHSPSCPMKPFTDPAEMSLNFAYF